MSDNNIWIFALIALIALAIFVNQPMQTQSSTDVFSDVSNFFGARTVIEQNIILGFAGFIFLLIALSLFFRR